MAAAIVLLAAFTVTGSYAGTKDGEADSSGILDNYTRFGDKEHGGWTVDGERLMDIIVGNLEPEAKSIDKITLYINRIGNRQKIYVFDFLKKEYLISQYKSDELSIQHPSANMSEPPFDAYNEPIAILDDLRDENIAVFFKDCTKYGLADWKRFYGDEINPDGSLRWGILVEYSDSTTLSSSGIDCNPETASEMEDAFYRLMGLGEPDFHSWISPGACQNCLKP